MYKKNENSSVSEYNENTLYKDKMMRYVHEKYTLM